MTFLGKMCLMIMLKGTKKQGFTLSVEDTFFEKPQEKVKLTPTPSLCPAVLELNSKNSFIEQFVSVLTSEKYLKFFVKKNL